MYVSTWIIKDDCFSATSTNKIRHRWFASSLYKSVKTLNLFKSTRSDAASIRKEQLYAWIYLLLLGSFGIPIFYSFMADLIMTKVYSNPSIEEYEDLFNLHGENLVCPCTKISSPYKAFITQLKVNWFHQICYEKNLFAISDKQFGTQPSLAFTNGVDLKSCQHSFVEVLKQLC